jgi:hypothetical protein
MEKEFWCRSHRRYISAIDREAARKSCEKLGGILVTCEMQEKPDPPTFCNLCGEVEARHQGDPARPLNAHAFDPGAPIKPENTCTSSLCGNKGVGGGENHATPHTHSDRKMHNLARGGEGIGIYGPAFSLPAITEGVAMPAGATAKRPGTLEEIPEAAIMDAAGAFMIELQDAYLATGIGREVEEGEVVPWIAEADPATVLGMHRALYAMVQRSRFLIAKLGFNERSIKVEEAKGATIGKAINDADLAAPTKEKGGRA